MVLSAANLADLSKFNQSFPQFYQRLATSEVQHQNYLLAYHFYRNHSSAFRLRKISSERSLILLAHHNSPWLLAEIFALLLQQQVTVQRFSLQAQVHRPKLVFLRLVVSANCQAITPAQAETLQSQIQALSKEKAIQFNLVKLDDIQADFAIDRVCHLPLITIASPPHPEFCAQVFAALAQEDLQLISANLAIAKGRIKARFYMLGPDGQTIPDHLGLRIANGLRQALMYGRG
ncbi:MAG: hypothetical protein SFT94_02505 [Pseudanabaenaceae cyanobacterium bins.68]|nr:hypothetical protein [Pseudanabaenaceae cyanobacterium bins.68]